MQDAFLRELFDGKPDNLYILIWTKSKNEKYSKWFLDTDSAARYVENCRSLNCYFGLGLSPRDRGPYERGVAEDVAGVVGVWADIDLAQPPHAKPNLPADEATIYDMIATLPEPTVVVHSGHGLQVYWLYKEPWTFDSPEERLEARHFSAHWGHTLRSLAHRKGLEIDAVHDITRVLRVPGTSNWNGPYPVDVKTLKIGGPRYSTEDLEQYLVDEAPTSLGPEVVQLGALILDPQAEPPLSKLEILFENEPKAKGAWDRTLKIADQSASGYDLSLANYAVSCGWNDQEIVDLLIASRRKHGDNLKLREDYYARTLAKARRDTSFHRAVENVTLAVAPTTQDERAATLVDLSPLLKVELRRVVKFLAEPEPRYQLVTGSGEIDLGDVSNLIKQPLLRNKLAAVAGVYLKEFTKIQWAAIAEKLLSLVEDVSLGEGATYKGMAHSWLTEYLSYRQPSSNIEEAAMTRSPFYLDGKTCIFLDSFLRYLSNHLQERGFNRVSVSRILKAYGCEDVRHNLTIAGKRTSREVWRLP